MFRPLTRIGFASFASATLATLSAAGAQAPMNWPPPTTNQGKTLVLICCTANDFYNYEVAPSEWTWFDYEVQPPPGKAPQDRDGFPAMALKAYETLRWGRGVPAGQFMTLLFHDDELGNSLCEVPVTGGPDNDVQGDEWINFELPTVVRNALWGPDGVQNTADDPILDYETLVVGQGPNQVTKDNLRAAIADLAADVTPSDKVFIYLVDHGLNAQGAGGGRYYFEAGDATPDPNDDYVTGDEFDGWLDQDFAGGHRPLVLVVMADFCFAQAFLQPVLAIESGAEQWRIGVASSGTNHLSWYHLESMFYPALGQNPPIYPGAGPVAGTPAGSHFFWPFWQHVALGATVQEAFDRAVNFAPAFVGTSVLLNQGPWLQDRGLAESYRHREVATSGTENWIDIEWRPQGDYALVVGSNAYVGKYAWNALAGAAGDYQLARLYSSGNSLEQVAWHESGEFALAVGFSGLVLRIDHNGGAPAVSVVNPPAQFATTTWKGCAATPSWTQLSFDGYDFVLVGFSGEIGYYQAGTRALVAAQAQGSASNAFLGCDVNPLEMWTNPSYPCDWTTGTTEVLIVGVTGAWQLRYTTGWRDPNCGQPTFHSETLTKVLDRPAAVLRRVKWHPLQNDFALCVGEEGGLGLAARLDAADRWNVRAVPETTGLNDLDFKPDLAYALAGGDDRTYVALPGKSAPLGSYRVLATIYGRDFYGLDWRPTNSQATAAAQRLSTGTRTSVDEFIQQLDF